MNRNSREFMAVMRSFSDIDKNFGKVQPGVKLEYSFEYDRDAAGGVDIDGWDASCSCTDGRMVRSGSKVKLSGGWQIDAASRFVRKQGEDFRKVESNVNIYLHPGQRYYKIDANGRRVPEPKSTPIILKLYAEVDLRSLPVQGAPKPAPFAPVPENANQVNQPS